MLELKKGIDILSEIGGIKTLDELDHLRYIFLLPSFDQRIGIFKMKSVVVQILDEKFTHKKLCRVNPLYPQLQDQMIVEAFRSRKRAFHELSFRVAGFFV